MKNFKNIISTLVFAILLVSASLICVLKPETAYSTSERRPLANFPKLNVETVTNGEFMQKFDEYATDQFPLRDKLRSVKAYFKMNIFNMLDNNGLFMTEGHISKIDEPENEYMMDYAVERFSFINNKYLQGKNTSVYFSIVPDKNFLLASKNGYPSLNYQNFIEKMKSKTEFMQYIDVTGLLSLDDYYKTDTHWKQENIIDIAELLATSMGTSIKSEYTINTLDNPFYGVYSGQLALSFPPDTIKYLTNDTINNATVTYYDTGLPQKGDMYNMEKAYSKDPYEMFLSGVAPLITIENPNANTEKELVLFRDSFGSSLAPLFAEGYKKITLVDIRYMQSSLIGNFVDFKNCDVLFLYSTTLLNNSLAMK